MTIHLLCSMKPFVISLIVTIAFTSTALSQGSPSGIPTVTRTTPAFGMTYQFTEDLKRDRTFWNKLIADKRRQYEMMQKEKQISKSKAEATLRLLEDSPMQSSRQGLITIICENGNIFVSNKFSKQHLTWMFLDDGIAITRPFSGGDALTIQPMAEIYSATLGLIPVLPIQFPRVKSFVDIATDEGRTTAKMFATSLGSDQYVSAELRFERGHLSEALATGIERTRYSDYTEWSVPIPKAMVCYSRFTESGEPQLTMTYTGKPIVNPKIPKIEDLVKAPIEVIDQRVEPYRQFTFVPGKGSILKQAESGRVIQNPQRLQDAPSEPMPFSTWLIGASLLLLIGVSIARIVQRRKSK